MDVLQTCRLPGEQKWLLQLDRIGLQQVYIPDLETVTQMSNRWRDDLNCFSRHQPPHVRVWDRELSGSDLEIFSQLEAGGLVCLPPANR